MLHACISKPDFSNFDSKNPGQCDVATPPLSQPLSAEHETRLSSYVHLGAPTFGDKMVRATDCIRLEVESNL
jgi:hypothetical protein